LKNLAIGPTNDKAEAAEKPPSTWQESEEVLRLVAEAPATASLRTQLTAKQESLQRTRRVLQSFRA